VSFIGQQARSGNFTRWLLTKVLPNTGVERILVTRTSIRSWSLGLAAATVTIHDAMTGAVLREVSEPGWPRASCSRRDGPVVDTTLRVGLALLFAVAAGHKLADLGTSG